MNTMSKFLLACSLFALAACDSDNNNRGGGPVPEFATVQVFHGSSDAPAVNVFVDGAEALSGVDYLQSSGFIGVAAGTHEIRVDAILPGGNVTVLGPVDLTFVADTVNTISAIGNVANIEASLITQPSAVTAPGSARLFVLHAAPGAVGPDFSLPVDVYVTVPGGALDMPVTFDFRETIGPLDVTAGDYQIRVFVAGSVDPADLVYDSGTLTLNDGDDYRVAAVPNTKGGEGLLTLVGMTSGGPVNFLDVRTPTALRVGHLSPDTGPVDVLVNGGVYRGGVPYPTVTGFDPLAAATYNVAVNPEASTMSVIGPVDLTLEAGTWYSVLAVDFFSNIGNPLILTDDSRPVATNAKVRIIHASPTAQDVDIYVVGPTVVDVTDEDPTLTAVPFRANTGYLALPEGDYNVIVTLTGSKDPAIGPAGISISNGGVYTAIARDPVPGSMEFGLIVLADVLNDAT